MPKLPRDLSGAKQVKLFEKSGWEIKRGKGSHVILEKERVEATLSVPQRKIIDIGLLRSLIQDSELSLDDFWDLYRKI